MPQSKRDPGDFAEEIRSHLQLEADQLETEGLGRQAAHATARRSFGNVTAAEELFYESQGARWLDRFLQDLRQAVRGMRTHPGFALTVVATLAVSLAASVAIFSVVNAVLLRPLPYRDAGRLTTLWTDDPKHNVHEEGVSFPTFNDWREMNRSFMDIAFFSRSNPVTLTGNAEPERVESSVVSPNIFDVLGVQPALGRPFSRDEIQSGQHVIVVSHALWQRRFGGASSAIGRVLEVDGGPWRVIGVMPASFQFPNLDVQFWQPLTSYRRWRNVERERFSDWGRAIGRLRPDVTFEQAQAEMAVIGQRLQRANPITAANADFAGFGVNLVPLALQITGKQLPFGLWVLFGAVLFVLLIACVNVANLLLARGAARDREMAVRHALGATRARIIQQLLTESLFLALAAELLGVGLAQWSVRVLIAIAPPSLPRLEAAAIDGTVLIFASVISLASGVLFGLFPALRLSRVSGALTQRDTQAQAGIRLRAALVIGEVALSAVLLCGAGVLIRSFLRVQAVDSGFRADDVLAIRMSASGNDANAIPVFQQVLQRISSQPGVTSAGVIEDLMQRRNPDYQITISDRPVQSAEPVSGDAVSPDYFRTVGIRLLKGRIFSDRDAGGTAVAIINETMAQHLWPREDPIGKQFRESDMLPKHPWYSVVGVVSDTRRQGLEQAPIAQIFWPYFQRPSSTMDVVIRTTGDPARVTADVRQAIRISDKGATILSVTTLANRLDRFLSPRRFQSLLLAALSIIALGLAAIGIYGLMHYSVAQRTTEIGIRIALGASSHTVLRMIVGEALTLATIGVATGAAGAVLAARALSTLLFGVPAADPVTFAIVPLVMGLVAVLASALPAWRASTLDPLVAVRQQ